MIRRAVVTFSAFAVLVLSCDLTLLWGLAHAYQSMGIEAIYTAQHPDRLIGFVVMVVLLVGMVAISLVTWARALAEALHAGLRGWIVALLVGLPVAPVVTLLYGLAAPDTGFASR